MTQPDTPETTVPTFRAEDLAAAALAQLQQQAIELQNTNTAMIQGLARRGISGADIVFQAARISALMDLLFGTADTSIQRCEAEILTQQRGAEALAHAMQMVEQAQVQNGQPHQRASGLLVAGRNSKINGSH